MHAHNILVLAGAASWYDAFLTRGKYLVKYGKPREYKHRVYKDVLHIVRNPIKVIESRYVTFSLSTLGGVVLGRCIASPSHIAVYWVRAYRLAIESSEYKTFLALISGQWEDVSDLVQLGDSNTANATHHTPDVAIRFALKHWVRRNSFVHQVASWREQIEELSTEPLVAWRICMAAGFGPRCPPLEHWRSALGGISKDTNTDTGKTNTVERHKMDWATLIQVEPMYAAIAMKMSLEFGYQVLDDEHMRQNLYSYGDISNLQYQCGFDQNQKWDCSCSVTQR
jgi:hypothetical protein